MKELMPVEDPTCHERKSKHIEHEGILNQIMKEHQVEVSLNLFSIIDKKTLYQTSCKLEYGHTIS